jgi:hypothetical protein
MLLSAEFYLIRTELNLCRFASPLPKLGDLQANLALYDEKVCQGMKERADFLLELSLTGYFSLFEALGEMNYRSMIEDRSSKMAILHPPSPILKGEALR